MRYLLLIYNTEPTEAVPEELMANEQAGYNVVRRESSEVEVATTAVCSERGGAAR